jgi:hypothetical protein
MSDDDYDYNDVVPLKYLVYSQFNAKVIMGVSVSLSQILSLDFTYTVSYL